MGLVDRLQAGQPLLVVVELGQCGVEGRLGGQSPQRVASTQRPVLTLQLIQIAFLLIQFPFQNGEIQGHQHLPLARAIAHLGVDPQLLPTRTGIEDACVVGIDQDAPAFYLSGDWPEQQSDPEQAAKPCQQSTDLAVI